MSAAKLLTLTMVLVVLGACATSPPTDYPKSPGAALQNTQDSTLGKKVSALKTGHPADESGFYVLTDGVDAGIVCGFRAL